MVALSQRTHRNSTPNGRSTCKFGRCSFAASKSQVIKHEVHEHLVRRFCCCACDKTLSSFESLRTHANSQHFRNRLFTCETCRTIYLDPARLAKCRKRHRGQFRCPEQGCAYHNARKNSVVRHLKTHHRRVADEADIPFDRDLSSNEPPKMRRVGASNASTVSSLPGMADSLLGLGSVGPSDDELFRRSEEKRRMIMEIARLEHAEWMGGEDALRAAIPDYPTWSQRDHPYGRPPSPDPDSQTNDIETDSSSGSSLSPPPELMVSSPEPIDASHVPSANTLRAWTIQASPELTTASSGLLAPTNSLYPNPRTPTPSSTAPAWVGSGHSFSDNILPNFNASTLPYPLSASTDIFNVPTLEPTALFSPNTMTSPLASPSEPWLSPLTPHQETFLSSTLYDSSNAAYGSQYSDDAASSQESLFATSPDPTFSYFGVTAHHPHDVKPGAMYSAGWLEGSSET